MASELDELYKRYEAAIESRSDLVRVREELERAEAICHKEITDAQEAIREWYVKQNLVAVFVADNEKD